MKNNIYDLIEIVAGIVMVLSWVIFPNGIANLISVGVCVIIFLIVERIRHHNQN